MKYDKLDLGIEGLQPGTKTYKRGACNIVVSPPYGQLGWHLSISTTYRDPTWEEIRDAWYDLVPDAEKRNAAMFFPPKAEYVNLHKRCFHVHEVALNCKMFITERDRD